jgi:hypothetical protein
MIATVAVLRVSCWTTKSVARTGSQFRRPAGAVFDAALLALPGRVSSNERVRPRSRRYVWVSKRRSEVLGDSAGGLADIAALERFDYR